MLHRSSPKILDQAYLGERIWNRHGTHYTASYCFTSQPPQLERSAILDIQFKPLLEQTTENLEKRGLLYPRHRPFQYTWRLGVSVLAWTMIGAYAMQPDPATQLIASTASAASDTKDKVVNPVIP